MEDNTRSRKWQITINNPTEKGFTHDTIKEILKKFKSIVYWCMADEIGKETQTYHTHIYICANNAIRFATLLNRFKGAHFEMCKGTSQENKDYVQKTGKWANSLKSETRVDNTFEEWGQMPAERQGKRNDFEDLYDMIAAGMSNYEILTTCPQYLTMQSDIERLRQTICEERYKDVWRDLEVHYVYGVTGAGKSRAVMEKYGYANCFRVTDSLHPFDNYKAQDVLIFEEFRSTFKIQDMLNYLDGYPLELPCRYANKIACYTKVYINTNIELESQFVNIQEESKETWQAFLRRINYISRYNEDGTIDTLPLPDYLEKKGFDTFVDVPEGVQEKLPF